MQYSSIITLLSLSLKAVAKNIHVIKLVTSDQHKVHHIFIMRLNELYLIFNYILLICKRSVIEEAVGYTVQ